MTDKLEDLHARSLGAYKAYVDQLLQYDKAKELQAKVERIEQTCEDCDMPVECVAALAKASIMLGRTAKAAYQLSTAAFQKHAASKREYEEERRRWEQSCPPERNRFAPLPFERLEVTDRAQFREFTQ